MRPAPTYFLLDGRAGWRTAGTDGASVDPGGLLRLAANPSGPLGLAEEHGSLGGLVLPRWLASDGSYRIYLLSAEKPRIRRFDPTGRRFSPLPAVGGEGSEARRFCHPNAIAVAGERLYVVDHGNHRFQVFHLESLALLHLWGPRDHDGRPVVIPSPAAVSAGSTTPCELPPENPPAADPWEPYDVAAAGDTAYLLDRRFGRVYRHRPGSGMVTVIDEPGAKGRWTRLACDRTGRLYLLDAEEKHGPRLQVYDPDGKAVGENITGAGQVRSLFDPPAIRVDHLHRFCLPESFAEACCRRPPAEPPPAGPLALCPSGKLVFDREGRPVEVDPGEPWGPPSYRRKGVWYSEPLDSKIYRCRWHRIEAELAALPPGTRLEVSTYSAEDPPGDVTGLAEHLWDTRFAVAGPLQDPAEADPSLLRPELLVGSGAGRHLVLRITLSSDGHVTPAVRGLRVHYPRRSYLEYLPAVYGAEEESRGFLERFLAIAQTEWDELERRVAEIARYFDPDTVPAGPFLDHLAQWLDLHLERRWSYEQKRRLLAAAPRLFPRRGTPGGLRDFLRIYLWNLSGVPPEQQGDYPVIVEGFRQRPCKAEWDPASVGRLQLGTDSAVLGKVRLISTGDPARDRFHEYAHRFRVFVPSAWVRTAEDEGLLRRALDAEKPAHTRYQLCLVESRLLVETQSTVGIDTIISDVPRTWLSCRDDTSLPPSRPPRGRLGHDTVLAGAPDRDPRLGSGVRVGINTVLS